MPLRQDSAATRSVTAFIAADPQAVWQIVTDVARTATWSDEVRECSWDEPVDPQTGPHAGQTFRAALSRGDMHWNSRSYVIDAEPGRRFSFAVGDVEHPAATWTYEIETQSGGCHVEYRVTLGDGRSMLNVMDPDPTTRPALEQRRLDGLAEDMARTLDQVRLAAETEGGH